MLAEYLGDGQDQVGGGAALAQFAVQFESDHRRQQHGDRLPEHTGLGLDSAHAPSQHAQAVDHGGVRIRAHHRIRIRLSVGAENHGREVLQVHLVDDAGIGRHHAEVPECRLAPAQQHVALAIALEFERGVEIESPGGSEVVHLDGVIDHQVGGQQRIGAVGVGSHGRESVAHGGQVDHAGHAGEILQQHARRHEADFFAVGALSPRHRFDILRGHAPAVFVTE